MPTAMFFSSAKFIETAAAGFCRICLQVMLQPSRGHTWHLCESCLTSSVHGARLGIDCAQTRGKPVQSAQKQGPIESAAHGSLNLEHFTPEEARVPGKTLGRDGARVTTHLPRRPSPEVPGGAKAPASATWKDEERKKNKNDFRVLAHWAPPSPEPEWVVLLLVSQYSATALQACGSAVAMPQLELNQSTIYCIALQASV